MRTIAFQLIVSGVALGIMGGAVGIHWLHLSAVEDLPLGAGSNAGLDPGMVASIALPDSSSRDRAKGEDDPAERHMARDTEILAGFREVVARLEELKTDNGDLRGQLEEANRHLDELELRVDSHSESFRPLRVSPGAIRQGSVSPGDTIQPTLLPPKGAR